MAMSAGKKAALTRRRRAAGRKAAVTRRRRAAGRKAARTRKRRAAGAKAAATRKRNALVAALRLPALTVKQPLAWAIIFGGKDVENRNWPTKHRGRLLIHAGGSYRTDARLPRGVHPPDREELDFSAIIGVVNLVDVVTKSKSPWFEGDYGFVLRKPRAMSSPIPCKGRLGLWTPTPGQTRLAQARLKS